MPQCTVIPTEASRRLFFAFDPANASARGAEVLCAIARFVRDESLFDHSDELVLPPDLPLTNLSSAKNLCCGNLCPAIMTSAIF